MTVVAACRDCHGPLVVVEAPDVQAEEDARAAVGIPRAWRYICGRCETVAGVALDYGTLELGIVRDSELRDPR